MYFSPAAILLFTAKIDRSTNWSGTLLLLMNSIHHSRCAWAEDATRRRAGGSCRQECLGHVEIHPRLKYNVHCNAGCLARRVRPGEARSLEAEEEDEGIVIRCFDSMALTGWCGDRESLVHC